MIIKIIMWLPLTLCRWVQAWLFPSKLFRYTYEPSSEAERERTVYVRNKTNLAVYKVKRLEHDLTHKGK